MSGPQFRFCRLPRRLAAHALGPRALGNDENGAALVEFAIIAPVLLMTILGILDVGHTVYTNSLVEGAIQMAARDSTVEGASSQEYLIDQKVRASVKRIVPSAELDFDRKAYSTFQDVGQPEDFTDTNHDGICNANEPYEDANGNAMWDPDRGTIGFGSARDSVLYTVRVEYPRAFPVANLIGLPPRITTEVSTVLRNQPYGEQASLSTIRNCL